jgi:hypothetical protein
MYSVCKIEVELEEVKSGGGAQRVAHLYCGVCDCTRSNTPIHPVEHSMICSFGRPRTSGFPLRARLSGTSKLPSAEDGDVNMGLNVCGMNGPSLR